MISIHIHVYHIMTHLNLTIILSGIMCGREVPFNIFHETDVSKSVSMSKSFYTFRIQGLSASQVCI